METCELCLPDLGPVVASSSHWRLIVNHNQNLLGKCFWVLRRHLEAVPDLSVEEWSDLHIQLARAAQALTTLFAPDHFNYAFLQNQDRHIHLHIIPRYATQRFFAEDVFSDPDYPGHYAPSLVHRLPSEALGELTTLLRQQLS